MVNDRTYAPDWTAVEREQFKADYLAGRPVQHPCGWHDDGECPVCDELRRLMREVDDAE